MIWHFDAGTKSSSALCHYRILLFVKHLTEGIQYIIGYFNKISGIWVFRILKCDIGDCYKLKVCHFVMII